LKPTRIFDTLISIEKRWVVLADSNITKRALAAAMKELVAKEPFAKISVADICDRCEMSRKSFYYHFKDKYDLVTWIFDSEFLELVRKNDDASITKWDRLEVFFVYLYENRIFYRKALQIEGQNSIAEHFRELFRPVLRTRLEEILIGQKVKEFYIDFFADAFHCAITRWLLSNEDMTPQEFLSLLKNLFEITSIAANME